MDRESPPFSPFDPFEGGGEDGDNEHGGDSHWPEQDGNPAAMPSSHAEQQQHHLQEQRQHQHREETNGHAMPLHLHQDSTPNYQSLSQNGMDVEYRQSLAETPQADSAIYLTATPTPTHSTTTIHSSPSVSAQQQPPQPVALAADDDDDDVIELSSDDGEDDIDSVDGVDPASSSNVARMPVSGGAASYQARVASVPTWMQSSTGNVNMAATTGGGYGQHIVQPGHSLSGYHHQQQQNNNQYNNLSVAPSHQYGFQPTATNYQPRHQMVSSHIPAVAFDTPQYITLPADFTPTWKKLISADFIRPKAKPVQQKKAFQLTLVNLKEFTITGLALHPDGPPTPVAGLRAVIKRISREHGKAIFEKDAGGVGGRWKIPIGAYQPFFAYLNSDPLCVHIDPIPPLQLKVASLGRARLEKDYPSAEGLVKRGVPFALPYTLAPFQRGGVDFVLEREGMGHFI